MIAFVVVQILWALAGAISDMRWRAVPLLWLLVGILLTMARLTLQPILSFSHWAVAWVGLLLSIPQVKRRALGDADGPALAIASSLAPDVLSYCIGLVVSGIVMLIVFKKKVIPFVVLPCVALIVSHMSHMMMGRAYANYLDRPDGMTIYSTRVFKDLIQNGDTLVVVHFEVDYSTRPTSHSIADAWLGILKDASGNTWVDVPYAHPFTNGSWGQGVLSFYLPAPRPFGWQSSLTVSLVPNPSLYPPTVPSVSYTLTPTDWTSPGSSQADNRIALSVWIRDTAQSLGNEWARSLLTTLPAGQVLSTDGILYYSNAIPNLQVMVPSLLPVRIFNPAFGTPVPPTHALSGATDPGRWGVWWVTDAFASFSNEFGLPLRALGMIFSAIIAGLTLFVAVRWTGDARIGLLAVAGMIVAFAFLGWIPIQLLFALAFLALVGVAYAFFFARG